MCRKDTGNVSKSVKIATTNLKWVPTAIAQTSHIKREKEGKRSKERKKPYRNHGNTTRTTPKKQNKKQVSGRERHHAASGETSGNLRFRTPVSRVAGVNSTTEPPMLTVRNTQDCEHICLSIGTYLSLPSYIGLFSESSKWSTCIRLGKSIALCPTRTNRLAG